MQRLAQHPTASWWPSSTVLCLVSHVFPPRGHMEVKDTELLGKLICPRHRALHPTAGLTAVAIEGIKWPLGAAVGGSSICLLGNRTLSRASWQEAGTGSGGLSESDGARSLPQVRARSGWSVRPAGPAGPRHWTPGSEHRGLRSAPRPCSVPVLHTQSRQGPTPSQPRPGEKQDFLACSEA